MTTTDPVHSETETHTWSVNVPDHPQRADQPEYTAAKNKMNEIAAQAAGPALRSRPVPGPPRQRPVAAGQPGLVHGPRPPRQASNGPRNFSPNPAKVDLLRQNAKRLYDLVAPQLKQELDPDGLLDTPITDADGVSKWTDSIFNAGVPLHQGFHIGVMPMGKAQAQNPPATPDTQNSANAGDQAQAAAAPGDPEQAGVPR